MVGWRYVKIVMSMIVSGRVNYKSEEKVSSKPPLYTLSSRVPLFVHDAKFHTSDITSRAFIERSTATYRSELESISEVIGSPHGPGSVGA